jgi:Leucine-rich repeat (LRR) protein
MDSYLADFPPEDNDEEEIHFAPTPWYHGTNVTGVSRTTDIGRNEQAIPPTLSSSPSRRPTETSQIKANMHLSVSQMSAMEPLPPQEQVESPVAKWQMCGKYGIVIGIIVGSLVCAVVVAASIINIIAAVEYFDQRSVETTTMSPVRAPSFPILPTSAPVHSVSEWTIACDFFNTPYAECITRTSFAGSFVGNTIPTEVGLLTQLTYLSIYDNFLIGTIPSTLGNLMNLRYLGVKGTQLTGTIPSTLGNLIQLTSLDLYSNQLVGTIPSSLGNIIQLISLALEENQLIGSIPSALGNFRQLQYLGLTGNQLTGYIPSELGYLTQLTVLSLSNVAQMYGTIPSSICNTPFARVETDCYMNSNIACSCCYNALSGTSCASVFSSTNAPVPSTLPTRAPSATFSPALDPRIKIACDFISAPNPECFNIRQTTGPFVGNTIPSELGLLTQLTSLSFYADGLTGTIPSTLGNLLSLQYLYLNENWLTGTIPSTLGNLIQLTYLGVETNQLTGTIPSTLGNLIRLTALELQRNHLFGTIPSTLGNLSLLTFLYLHDNQLFGTIPSELGDLWRLEFLSLNGNQLTGSIPSEMGGLSLLRSLTIYNNTQLGGTVPSLLCNTGFTSVLVDCDSNGDLACSCCYNGFTSILCSSIQFSTSPIRSVVPSSASVTSLPPS